MIVMQKLYKSSLELTEGKNKMKSELIEMIGKYAHWRCLGCGFEHIYMVSFLTTQYDELVPTRGWECPECGRRLIFQRVIKENE